MTGHVLFTNHVIGQIPGHTRRALDCLLRAWPAEVIHIEPCALLATLNDLAAQRRLKILEARLLGYSPRLANAPAFIRWRPVTEARTAR